MSGFDDRFSAIERRFDSIDRRFDFLEARIDRFRAELNGRIDALDQKMSRQFTWIVGIQVAVLLAVVAGR